MIHYQGQIYTTVPCEKMLNRKLSSVATKHLGRTCGYLQPQSTRTIAALSRPSPLFRTQTACTTQIFENTLCQRFSEMPLRRPPSRDKNGPRDAKQKWRSHAVSLGFGNYQDDDDYDGFGNSVVASSTSIASTNSAKNATSSAWDEEESELAERVQEIQREDDEQRKRWLENAKPPVRHSIVDERGRAYGRGGRKTASARVWIQPGFGNVVINRKEFVDYFQRTSDRELILEPLAATETLGRFDVSVTVEGGGLTGQAGAIRHGLARALNHYNPDVYRPPLKRLGYLTRDPRKVERKKIGHLKARKKPQWVKR